MAQLPNPHSDRPFDEVRKDANGEDEWGIRQLDGVEEIVHIPTNKSNVKYWQPEPVVKPQGCEHQFRLVDVGAREVICDNCNLATTFHVGVNYYEQKGQPYFTMRGKSYPISL